jgi:hypothetical protein
MGSPASGVLSRWSVGDGNDLAQFASIVAAHEVGSNSIVVETSDSREIRITAWRDLSTHRYVSVYERHSTIKSGMKEFRVWAATPAYAQCTADSIDECLESAMLEVDKIRLY